MRIALYARVSTQDQYPEAQLQPLREYAQRRGAEAVEFVDHDVSGPKDHRNTLDRLMAAVQRREMDAVAVTKLDLRSSSWERPPGSVGSRSWHAPTRSPRRALLRCGTELADAIEQHPVRPRDRLMTKLDPPPVNVLLLRADKRAVSGRAALARIGLRRESNGCV